MKVRYLTREKRGPNKERREMSQVCQQIQPLVLQQQTKSISVTTSSLQDAVQVGLNIFLTYLG